MDNTSTRSEPSFEVARMWLSDCLSNHSACRKPGTFRPTRLIDVGPGNGSIEPFLQETAALSEHELKRDYVALSHCWGKQKFRTTVKSNLTAHQKAISMADLPPTFQDAVEVVRKMNLRYLWIDSLCIVQDSKEDWESESVRMCQIYEHALFTITSAHASSAYGGLFVQRDGVRTLPFEIQFPEPLGKYLFLSMGQREKVWGREELPIYTRGWCLQELILSCRTLIFDPDGVRWECLTCHASERSLIGGVARHEKELRDMQNAIGRSKVTNGELFDLLGDSLQMQSMSWQSIIQNFTSRNLTKYTDKLIALAGVADAIQSNSKHQYVAGMWKDHLYMELLWYVLRRTEPIYGSSGHTPIVREPPPYREKDAVAPSWSWASVNVRVVFEQSMSMFPLCEVIDVRITGSAHRQSGYITIHGDLRKLYVLHSRRTLMSELQRAAKSPKYQYTDSSGVIRTNLLSHNVMLAAENSLPADDFLGISQFFSSIQALSVQFEPEEEVDDKMPITFIAIAKRPPLSGMSIELGRQLVYTLALVPTNEDSREYRRIGWAAWDDCTWYGYDCALDKHLKAEAYRKLAASWGRIKPPILCSDVTHEHPIKGEPLADSAAYHPSTKMERARIRIV